MPSPKSDESQNQRIAKLLARAGVASRREVERMIADGRVARDGVAIDTPATVLASLDGVTVDGNPVEAPAEARLFLFHKPSGVLTAERDFSGRPTIYDRLPKDLPRLVPVGRLDLNTEGLLLLTTDGGFKRQLELPSTGVERAYRARGYGQVSQAQLEDLMHGIEIEGIRYGSINANLERRTGANVWIEMILTEGKNREVRRVLEHLGLRVSRLIRTRYGPFVLGDLPAGGVGEVRQADLAAFRQALKLPRGSESATPIAVTPSPLPGRGRDPLTERRKGEGQSDAKSATPRPAKPTTPQKSVVPKPQRSPSRAPLPERVAGGQRPALSRSCRGPDRPDTGPGVGASAASSAGRPTPSPSLIQGGESSSRKRQLQKPATRKPEPTHGREERDELETRAPRRDRVDASPTPRPPKPVRKAGWAKAKPKARTQAKPRGPGK